MNARVAYRRLLMVTLAVTISLPLLATGSQEQTDPTDGPVTLRVYSAQLARSIPAGIMEDEIAGVIEEDVGVLLDVETQPSTEKLTAMLAARDLMDVMYVPFEQAEQMIEGNLVTRLDPLIERYGQDLVEHYPEASLGFSRLRLSNGTGDLYFIPNSASAANVTMEQVWGGAYLRWDYYAELGHPPIRDYDDYLQVVADMKELHPTNEDGRPYFGFSLWFDWGPFIQTSTMTVRDLGREQLGGTVGGLLEVDRTTFEPTRALSDTTSGFWEGVRFWRKANQMGLLDQDSFTQQYGQALQKYNSGQVLASMINWMPGGGNNWLRTEHDTFDKGWWGPVPIEGSRSYFHAAYVGGNGRGAAIAESSEYKAEAMKLLNWLGSEHGAMTVFNGIEGVDWVREGDSYRLTDHFWEVSESEDSLTRYGINNLHNNVLLNGLTQASGSDQPRRLEFSRDVQIARLAENRPEDALTRRVIDYYGVDVPSDVMPAGTVVDLTRYGTELGPYIDTTAPEDIKLVDQRVSSYVNQVIPRLILAESDAEFSALQSEFLAEIERLDVETLYEFYEGVLSRAIEASEQAQEF